MTLRSKAFLTVIAITCGLIIIVLIAAALFLQHRALSLEQALVQDNVRRVLNTIDDELSALDKFTFDWSNWDDTYTFLKTQSPAYVQANLSHGELLKQGISVMVFVNTSGTIIYATGLTLGYDEEAPVLDSLTQLITQNPSLTQHHDEQTGIKGIVVLPEFPVLFVSRPVLTSQYKGPSTGALITGKYLSSAKIEELSKKTRLNVSITTLSEPLSSQHKAHRTEAITVEPRDNNRITGAALLSDVSGNPAVMVRVEMPRVITRQFRESLFYFIAAFIVIALITAGAIYVIADKAVLKPLTQLASFIHETVTTQDLSRRVTIAGTDEISAIASAVNTMLQTIEQNIQTIQDAEKKAYAAQTFLENVFRASADGIVISLKNSIIYMVNKSFCNMLGYTQEELIGQNVNEFLPSDPTTLERGIKLMNQLFEQGFVKDFEMQYLHKNGTPVDVELSAAVIKDGAGDFAGIVAMFRDITDRKKAETEKKRLKAQLSRAEKMETVGLLAGGVAHDLNNMLGAIIGYPDLLLEDLPADSPLRPAIKAIKDSGERAAAIVHDMLTLTRRGVVTHEVINLNTVIRGYLESRECAKLKEFHPQVTILHTLDPSLPNVIGSQVHLTKVIANLVSNAAEAITGEGSIHITTRTVGFNEPLRGYETIEPGEYVVLSVADTGCGIAPEDQQRIFEPFYTKKVMGRSGTGLGMSVVWNTVKDMGGSLDLMSEPGKGTMIALYLPATREQEDAEKQVLPLSAFMGNRETVLVVDDVEAQRHLAEVILKRLNYQVNTVKSGEEAVEYLKNHTADLLVLDMIMDPGMDGLDTYRAILKIRPGQKAVIASGFAETERVKEAQELGAGAFVRKPYTIERLGRAVKKELSRS